MIDATNAPSESSQSQYWPDLPLDAWRETRETLHMWTQIIGKMKLPQEPWTNHSWHVTFYLTARGLTTSPIPYGERIFEIDFDFIDHLLLIRAADGRTRTMQLRPRSVADFYAECLSHLVALGFDVKINTMPNELAEAIPFDKDNVHASYDAEYANRFWRVLLQTDRVFKKFRAGFIGKCSPVHFFWGSFDLAVTRFSGRAAPRHPGGIPHLPDWASREAYSHEVSSCGFWPGGPGLDYPCFYSYAYPEPAGFGSAAVRPSGAVYNSTFGEWILPYDEVRRAASPEAALLEFLQSAYDAAADLGKWDREALERRQDPRVLFA